MLDTSCVTEDTRLFDISVNSLTISASPVFIITIISPLLEIVTSICDESTPDISCATAIAVFCIISFLSVVSNDVISTPVIVKVILTELFSGSGSGSGSGEKTDGVLNTLTISLDDTPTTEDIVDVIELFIDSVNAVSNTSLNKSLVVSGLFILRIISFVSDIIIVISSSCT